MIDDLKFIELSVKNILDKAEFLKDSTNKLASLRLEIYKYRKQFPDQLDNSMILSDLHLSKLIIITYQLIKIPLLSKYQPKIFEVFNLFYRKFSYKFSDMPSNLQADILSYFSPTALYPLTKINIASTQTIESIYIKKIPQIFAKLLDDIKTQLKKNNPYSSNFKAIFDKLTAMQLETQTQVVPTTLNQALNYLNHQRTALVFALSLANKTEIKKIQLPCTIDLIKDNTKKTKSIADNCSCEIHTGLKQSLLYSTYNREMENGFSYLDQVEEFFKELAKVDHPSALKALDKIVDSRSDNVISAINGLAKSGCFTKSQQNVFSFDILSSCTKKDQLIRIICEKFELCEFMSKIYFPQYRDLFLSKWLEFFESSSLKPLMSYLKNQIIPLAQTIQDDSIRAKTLRNIFSKVFDLIFPGKGCNKNYIKLYDLFKDLEEFDKNLVLKKICLAKSVTIEIKLKLWAEITNKELKNKIQLLILADHLNNFNEKLMEMQHESLTKDHQDAIIDEIMTYEESFRNLLLQDTKLYVNLNVNLCLTLMSKIPDHSIKDKILVSLLDRYGPEDLKNVLLIIIHIEDKKRKDEALLEYLNQYLPRFNNPTIFLSYFTDDQMKKIAEDLIKIQQFKNNAEIRQF